MGLDRIIEATVPKGSKRARPPPDLAPPKSAPTAPEPRRSTRLKSPEPSAPKVTAYRSFFEDKERPKPKPNGAPVVQEIDEEEDEIVEASPPKKAISSLNSLRRACVCRSWPARCAERAV